VGNNPLIAADQQGTAALSREVEAWLDLSVLPSSSIAGSSSSIASACHVPINGASINSQQQKTLPACGSNTLSFDLPNNPSAAVDQKSSVVLGKTPFQHNNNSAAQYCPPMIPPVWGEYYYGGDVPHFGSVQPALVAQPAPLMEVASNANSVVNHIQQAVVPPSALGSTSKPNALQIELFHKPKKSAVGWQQMHEGESIRVTHQMENG
jgi:hypothetical protein